MRDGLSLQEHIDRAITLNPGESTLHHLRGRFCFEVRCGAEREASLPTSHPHQVAGVSWLEKKAAAALFGSPPESTYQEALDNLMKVHYPTLPRIHS